MGRCWVIRPGDPSIIKRADCSLPKPACVGKMDRGEPARILMTVWTAPKPTCLLGIDHAVRASMARCDVPLPDVIGVILARATPISCKAWLMGERMALPLGCCPSRFFGAYSTDFAGKLLDCIHGIRDGRQRFLRFGNRCIRHVAKTDILDVFAGDGIE